MKRLARLERQLAQQTTRPPESAAEDVRVFDYGVGSPWLGRFDHDIMMANLAVLPEPTPAEEVDREQ
jgi:hypothetical protein